MADTYGTVPAPIQTILLATDISSTCRTGLLYAAALARHFQANLAVVHVVDMSIPIRNMSVPEGCIIEAMRSSCETHLRDLAAELEGVSVTTRVEEAFTVADGLVAAAEALNADLMIMNGTCKGWLRRAISKSTCDQVLAHAKCPVLMLGPRVKRPVESALSFRSIVCADSAPRPLNRALQYSLELAEAAHAQLYACHVREGAPDSVFAKDDWKTLEHLEGMVANSSHPQVKPECLVQHGSAASATLSLAKRVGADLIVVGPPRADSLGFHLAESPTEALLAHADCPVLTVC